MFKIDPLFESTIMNTYVIPFFIDYFMNGLTICLFILPSDIIMHNCLDYELESYFSTLSNYLKELDIKDDIDKS